MHETQTVFTLLLGAILGSLLTFAFVCAVQFAHSEYAAFPLRTFVIDD